MKKITLLLLIINATLISAQTVFINEIHYDNVGGDVNEAFEIAGPADTDLSTYSIILYNGNGGAPYNTTTLSGVIPNQQNGFGTLTFIPEGSIQNGGPDGIVLANDTTVIQFLSYEGSFTAVGGLADGMTSIDIGVSESGSTETSESLQLSGLGSVYTDFTWQEPAVATQGEINNGQTFDVTVLNNPTFTALENEIVLYPNPSSTGTVALSTPINSEVEATLYNSLGDVVSTQRVNGNEVISTEGLAAGIYFVQLTIDGNTITKRIVVQ